MRRTWQALPMVALLVSGCAIRPERAVMRAAAAAPRGVEGTFDLTIRGVGWQSGHTYLNSEADYRDQRNLTIAMDDAVAERLWARGPIRSAKQAVGWHVRVRGTAERIRIYFFANGVVTDKYYYQTHVTIADPARIRFVSR